MTGWSRACVLFYLTLTCDGALIGDELSGLTTHYLFVGVRLCSELVTDLWIFDDENA